MTLKTLNDDNYSKCNSRNNILLLYFFKPESQTNYVTLYQKNNL